MSPRQITVEGREDTINTTDGKCESNSSRTACHARGADQLRGWMWKGEGTGLVAIHHSEKTNLPNCIRMLVFPDLTEVEDTQLASSYCTSISEN